MWCNVNFRPFSLLFISNCNCKVTVVVRSVTFGFPHLPLTLRYTLEPPHDKTNKMICAPSQDSDRSRHRSDLSLRCALNR